MPFCAANMHMPAGFYLWIALAVVFAALEGMSAQLMGVWFALGAVAAVIASACGASVPVQVAIFASVSVIALVATRPLVKKLLKKRVQPTNADRCIGEKAVVTEEIDNTLGKGAAKVGGVEWTARSETDAVIPAGAYVRVTRIDGVKLIVEPVA